MDRYKDLKPGDPAPWFRQASFASHDYAFDTAAGRYIVICFFGSAADPHSQAAIEAARSYPEFFNDQSGCFFGVSNHPSDRAERRVADHYPGYRYFWDFDGKAGKLYGALPLEAAAGDQVPVRRIWIVLDPTLRVLKVIPFAPDRSDIGAVLQFLRSLPPPKRFSGIELQAPILLLPNVFEPELCQKLMALYETHGGEQSGFMHEKDGKTVFGTDHKHKQRRDYRIQDKNLIADMQQLFKRRVVPEIQKAYQFVVTRMERQIVACYLAEEEAHFAPHRDNTTKGTAHRRFAVSVNLNDDFDGGQISFPEYGPSSFKPPTGGAVIFSCSLLHSVSKVTRGRRYAYLPFLYDEAAAKVREVNNEFLGEGLSSYSAERRRR